jgi:DNA-binding CsgD family transcriptional regulator
MPLLERESALAWLATLAAEARARAGRLALISGEAGAGKSALVERFERDLPDASWFWSYCDGLSTPRPLGPVHDLAGQVGGELQQMCRRDASRQELFGAVLRQFEDADSLSVVVVEDVHWADQSTVDLLRYLARRLRDVPLLLIATYRDDVFGATDALRIALGDLARQRPSRRMSLEPLSPEAVRVLADGSSLDHLALHRLTSGNPFFVTEVIRAGVGAVPTSARDAVLARAAGLTTESRRALEFAALIGARADVGLLRFASGCGVSAVDELVSSGLLAGDGEQLTFRHEIARLAVLGSIPAHRLRPMHSAILDAMRAGVGDDTALTYHAEAAGDHASVVHYARRAAQHAAKLGSHREAAAQYERALRFAASMPQELLAGLLDGLAEELFLIDRWHDAEMANRKAKELWHRLDDRLREGAASRRMAQTLWRQCLATDGMSAAREAIAMLETVRPSRELARAYATLALGRMTIDPADSIELAGKAITLAERLNVPEALVDGLGALGCIAIDTDGDWVGLLDRALRIAVAGGFEEQAARAFGNLHAAYSINQRFADAEPYYVDGLAYCDAHGLTTFANWLVGDRTVALERQGRWDESAALGAELIGQAGVSPLHRLVPLTSLGVISARRGSGNPWTELDEALAAAEASADPAFIVVVRNARAEARWLAADLDSARHEAEAAAAHATGTNPWDRGATAAWLNRTFSSVTVDGSIAEPYQMLAQGEWEKAAHAWAVLGCPYEQAVSLVDSDQEQALRTALNLLAGLGAKAAIRIARHRLRSKGVRSVPYGPHTATRAHPSGLTRREIEVLALMNGGNTNAEIATRLFISAKTVDHHVSSILAKLEVPSRRAAVAKATQLGWISVSG